MTQPVSFKLLVDQRHFHFIILRDIGGYTLNSYWTQAADAGALSKQADDINYPEFEIQHRELRTNTAYPRGRLLETVSLSKDGSPPYLYDLFGLKILIDSVTYFAFVFPFSALALEITDRIIDGYKIRRICEIIKVDLSLLVGKIGSQTDVRKISSQVVGLQAVISDDPVLHSVSLGGDDPLKSSIYKNFLLDPIRKGITTLEQCVLKCELQPPIADSFELSAQQRRARVHLDAFGNFKFYVHISGKNFATIPFLVQLLKTLECLDTTSVNPLHRLQEEDALA